MMTVAQEKTPLILLPGSLCGPELWIAQAQALADVADVQVIESTDADTIEAMAEHVLSRARWPRFALAGFSLGGFIAFDVLRQAPGRVTHLALLDTSASPDNPANAPRRLANIEAFDTEPHAVLDAFVEMTRGSQTPGRVVDAVRASMYALGLRFYAPQQRAMLHRPDARGLLEQVQCPTLVLCGSEDRATPPPVSREIAQGIAGARYVELVGVGHMTPLEAPQEVSQALREWLGFPKG